MMPTSLLTAPRSRQSLSAEAYCLLKEKIITLELAPASLIDEAQLSDMLGISRTPIREALLRLQQESLVIILPRRGTIVADLNARDLQKIYEIRIELEPYAVGLAAERATKAQIAAMQQWSERAADAIRAADARRLLAIDHQGHQLFAQATQNEFLEATLEQLFSPMLRMAYWYASRQKLGSLPREVEDLRGIVEAIEQRAAELAQQLMRQHVLLFQQELLMMI